MGATATRMTAEEFFAVSVEGDHKQLVDGAIVVAEPRPIHSVLQGRLHLTLALWVDAAEGRGLVLLPTDVVLDEFNVYGPDLIWIAERHRPSNLRERLARVPELCVEIRSPGTWRYDVGAKKSGGCPSSGWSTTWPRPFSSFAARRPKSPRSTSRSSSAAVRH
jgi:Uma2 family endonuclease